MSVNVCNGVPQRARGVRAPHLGAAEVCQLSLPHGVHQHLSICNLAHYTATHPYQQPFPTHPSPPIPTHPARPITSLISTHSVHLAPSHPSLSATLVVRTHVGALMGRCSWVGACF